MAVNLEFTGDPQKLVDALAKVEKQLDALQRKNAEGGAKSKRMSDEELRRRFLEQREIRKLKEGWEQAEKAKEGAMDTSMISSATTKMATMLAGVLSTATAMRAIRAEFENIIELQNKQRDSQMELGVARGTLALNMPSASQAEFESTKRRISEIGKRVGVKESIITGAYADAFSASGNKPEVAANAVEVAARLMKVLPESIPRYAGSMVDLEKVTGTSNAMHNAGVMQFIAGLSRVVKPEYQAESIAPSMIGQMAFRGDVSTSGAVFAALSSSMGDVHGRQSKTATIQLAKNLTEYFDPGNFAVGSGPVANAQNRMFSKLFGGGKLNQRQMIHMLQQFPELANRFLSAPGVSFEVAALGPVRNLLLNQNSPVARDYAAGRAAMAGADFQGTTSRMISNMSSDTAINMVGQSSSLDAATNRLLTGGPGARTALVRQQLNDALQASGESWLRRQSSRLGFESSVMFGQDPAEAAIEIIERRRNGILSDTAMGGGYGSTTEVGRSVTAEDQRNAAGLAEVAGILREMLAETRKNGKTPTLGNPNDEGTR